VRLPQDDPAYPWTVAALAADRLRDTDLTLGSTARQAGYGSAFALSTAFKRGYGVSPQEHRAGLNREVGPGVVGDVGWPPCTGSGRPG
jgi:hypothetical protein